MPNHVTLDTSEWQQFLKDFSELISPEGMREVIHEAADEVGVALDEIARSKLPPPQKKVPQGHTFTARQRRWWWATMHDIAEGKRTMPGWRAAYVIRNGIKTLEISGQYKRTGTLVKSLAYKIVDIKDGSEVHYGTNRDYARWVIDEANQAWFHKAGGWPTLQAIARERREDIAKIATARAVKEARKKLGIK